MKFTLLHEVTDNKIIDAHRKGNQGTGDDADLDAWQDDFDDGLELGCA